MDSPIKRRPTWSDREDQRDVLQSITLAGASKRPPANDNRESPGKFAKKWLLRTRMLLLPLIGAAILIYAMTH